MEIISTRPGVIEIISYKCVNKLIDSPNFNRELKRLNKILIQSKKLQINIPEIEKLSQIKNISENLNEKIKTGGMNSDFPVQPLPDNEFITALKTPSEMRAWAIQQRNCIRSYIKDVKLRKCCFYKVNYNGEEATLEIRTGRAGIKMGQLRGKKNKIVSKELRIFVINWFMNKI